MRISFYFLLFCCSQLSYSADYTRAEYIDRFQEVAISEMKLYGIPASITLAQGLLESNNGNSMLATKANNHFGIKCHSNWEGKRIYKDDDAKNECFRVYSSAWESFRDHSKFLQSNRYQFLYEFKSTDYKSWARGLKKAGYATDPKYPDLLIKIIEDNCINTTILNFRRKSSGMRRQKHKSLRLFKKLKNLRKPQRVFPEQTKLWFGKDSVQTGCATFYRPTMCRPLYWLINSTSDCGK